MNVSPTSIKRRWRRNHKWRSKQCQYCCAILVACAGRCDLRVIIEIILSYRANPSSLLPVESARNVPATAIAREQLATRVSEHVLPMSRATGLESPSISTSTIASEEVGKGAAMRYMHLGEPIICGHASLKKDRVEPMSAYARCNAARRAVTGMRPECGYLR